MGGVSVPRTRGGLAMSTDRTSIYLRRGLTIAVLCLPLISTLFLASVGNADSAGGHEFASSRLAPVRSAPVPLQTSSCPNLPAQGAFQGKTDFNTVKAQLWYNDGLWWGAFSDGLTGVAIHKENGGTFEKGEIIDGNIAGKPDVIWNGTNLFVMVYKSGALASFYKYSYSTVTKTYTLLPNFPVNLFVDGNANIINIEQDSTGKIWAAYTGTLGAAGDGAVHVIYTASADHTVWDTGGQTLHTGFATGINAVEEVAAIVHFGGNKIGVVWSDQTAKKISFRYHQDGQPESAWSLEETIDSGLGPQGFGGVADDHMSIKAAPDGRLFLIAKDDDEPAPGTGAHLHLYIRSAAGTWGSKTIVNPDFSSAPTRPVLLLDITNKTAYVFYRDTSPAVANKIVMAKTSMDSPSFSTPCTFLDTIANNTTGTKQNLDSSTDLLMAASTGTLGGQVIFNKIDLASPGYEGDVAPRPNGNGTGSVSISDWVLCGRFAAGLDVPAPGSEFQRADTAPRSSFGSGTITISDWVQCGRYAAALDPVANASGPSTPPSAPSFDILAKLPKLAMYSAGQPLQLQSVREVRVVGSSISAGQSGTVTVELVSEGNENGVGFSLTFDTTRLTFVSATLAGTVPAGAALNVNTSQTTSGRVGIALALPSAQTFTAGTRQLVVVTFSAAPSASGSTPIGFADQPVEREVADAVANVLPALFTPGSVNVTSVGNPVPILSSLAPTSALAGGGQFTLTVNGANFINGSVVRFNGSSRTTTFVNPTQLQATITAADIATAGTSSVTVFTGTPGGGLSSASNFVVNNPVPVITSLSPSSATVNGPGFQLTVNGANFINGSVVRFAGSNRTTTFVNSTQVKAQITAADISGVGNFPITVFNPTPGGGESNAFALTVTSVPPNPIPVLDNISPTIAPLGGSPLTLTVNGSHFLNSSIVRFEGADRATTFVNATRLTAQIPASDLVNGGVFQIKVVNPSPGGGLSNPVNFTVNNPTPTVSSLSPASAQAGGLPLSLTVNGTNFINGSVVNFGGAARTTTFVNSTLLTAQILASDIAAAGTPDVTVTNPAPGGGTSGAKTFTITPQPPNSRVIRIVNVVARPGDPVEVPIELVSQGDENAIGFSVSFDPAHLTFVSAARGPHALTTVLNVNSSQASVGRIGIAQSLSAGEAFAAGVRKIVVLTFTVPLNTSGLSTNIGLTSQPIAQELVSPVATHLTATFTDGVVTFVQGYEADAFPRPNGDNNGLVTIIDWSQIGRFAAGLDLVSPGGPGGEFQRADCAPKETLGDGVIQISDWVQAGRYAALLDPIVRVGGATAALAPAMSQLTTGQPTTRIVRVVNATVTAGQQATISVELEAQGNENALGFSVVWDTTKLTYVSDAAGSGATGATINFNRSQTGSGRLGIGMALPAGNVFSPGARQLVTVTFNVNAAATGTTQVSFGDVPIGREVVDVTANSLTATFNAGTLTINAAGSPAPTISSLSPTSKVAGSAAFTLTVNGTNYVSNSVVRYGGSNRTTTFVNATQLTAQITAADIAIAGTFPVTVFTPAPGGGTSNAVNFTVDTPTPVDTFQFSSSSFNTNEGVGVTINVTRSGNTQAATTVEYETVNGTATERRDFTTALGTLIFAPGETQKTITLLTTEDTVVEGSEALSVKLTNPSNGFTLGSPSTAVVNIVDDPVEPSGNSNDDSQLFVRQHYHDFLNRDPDAAGLAFWVNEIEQCGPDAHCREVKRINVSAAFYLSIEFQETGFYVYRLYKSSLPPTAQRAEGLPRYAEFLRDTQRVGRGVAVGVGNWAQILEQNRKDFADEFVLRSEFLAKYPASLTAAQYVDALNAQSNGVLSQSERNALVAGLTGGSETRATVLRKVADDADFRQAEFNRAFVLMQYIGYLRRSPNDPPDTNLDGLTFWLTKLNQFHGSYIDAEMVKAFLSSIEYRLRFGP